MRENVVVGELVGNLTSNLDDAIEFVRFLYVFDNFGRASVTREGFNWFEPARKKPRPNWHGFLIIASAMAQKSRRGDPFTWALFAGATDPNWTFLRQRFKFRWNLRLVGGARTADGHTQKETEKYESTELFYHRIPRVHEIGVLQIVNIRDLGVNGAASVPQHVGCGADGRITGFHISNGSIRHCEVHDPS
jgi:hypothetical protein